VSTIASRITPVPWIGAYAARHGLHYTPEADERWLRAWEPYATLRVPLRYEHVLEATGEVGSLTIARFVVTAARRGPEGPIEAEASAWIAIAQDVRVGGRASATSDVPGLFGEGLELVTMPRRSTADPTFDRAFATFAPSEEELSRAITPSVRRIALSWQTPVHIEVRAGGFVLAPVALRADPESLSWLVRAVHAFGEKARLPTGGASATARS
jgi:hypothetical protein